MATVPALVKWGKEKFTGITLTPGSPADALKQQLFELTGVLPKRQKLMCKGGWKGALKDGTALDAGLKLKAGQSELTIMMVGSSVGAAAPPAPPGAGGAAAAVKFEEDFSAEELAAEQEAAIAVSLADVEGMIPALQEPPGLGRDDGKAMAFQYNHFVWGLPQAQIESALRRRREAGARAADGSGDGGLLGEESAMQLGVELGRALITALAVLADGTLVSGADNGRIQLWRHAQRLEELLHEPAATWGGDGPGAVECLVPFAEPAATAHGHAFASGASGVVHLWTGAGECTQSVVVPPGMTPASLVPTGPAGHLAIACRQARPFDPHAFRLPPQNEEQRRRRAEARAQQEAQQRAFVSQSATVAVVGLAPVTAFVDGVGVQPQQMLRPPAAGGSSAAAVTALVALGERGGGRLVSGDALGGLQLWTCSLLHATEWISAGRLQLMQAQGGGDGAAGAEGTGAGRVPDDVEADGAPAAGRPGGGGGGDGGGGGGGGSARCLSVVCMEALTSPHVLAVSTAEIIAPAADGRARLADGTAVLEVPRTSGRPGSVVLVDVSTRTVLAVLAAHTDIITCMCAIPGGGLVTGGGKRDATVKIWHPSQWNGEKEGAAMVLHEAAQSPLEPGYVFALTTLPDTKPGSTLFALAGAWYNRVKICL